MRLNTDLQELLAASEKKLASMVKHGTAAQCDLNNVTAERLNVVQQHTTLESQYRVLQSMLATFCGIEITGLVKPAAIDAAGADNNRPELSLIDSQLRLADDEPEGGVARVGALGHRIALWDTIRSCTITGSSDSSIRDVVPNDLSVILNNSRVKTVYCNGAASYKLYQKYIYPINKIKAEKLPSTSPANAAWSMDRLEKAWSVIRGE